MFLNPEAFLVVVGQDVVRHVRELHEKHCLPGCRPNTYESESLVSLQTRLYREGHMDVELVESVYGWSVRNASGLGGFALMAGKRYGNVDGSLESAVNWARDWASKDPSKRFAWVRRHGLTPENLETLARLQVA
jgi:hypothetical protein